MATHSHIEIVNIVGKWLYKCKNDDGLCVPPRIHHNILVQNSRSETTGDNLNIHHDKYSQVWRFGELAFCPQKSLAEFTSRVHPLIYTIRKTQFNPIVTCVWRCRPGDSKIKNYRNGHQNALKSCKHNNRWCNVHAQFVNTAKKQKKCNSLFQGTLNLWSLVLKRNPPLSISLEA